MAFKTKESALRAARKALGPTTVEGLDFTLRNTGAGWDYEAIEAANEPAKKAQAKKATVKPAPKAPVKAEKPPKASGKVVVAEAPPKAPTGKPCAPEGQTKTDMLVAMMSTPGGATSSEMEQATGWAPHSVRGLIGTLKKRGVHVESKKLTRGEPTVYKIPAPRSEARPTAEAVGDVI